MCSALNYQIISIFPIVYEGFLGEEYSLVYDCSLTHDYDAVNSVPIETNRSFIFNVKGCKFPFSFTM